MSLRNSDPPYRPTAASNLLSSKPPSLAPYATEKTTRRPTTPTRKLEYGVLSGQLRLVLVGVGYPIFRVAFQWRSILVQRTFPKLRRTRTALLDASADLNLTSGDVEGTSGRPITLSSYYGSPAIITQLLSYADRCRI